MFSTNKRRKAEEYWLNEDLQVEWRPQFLDWRGDSRKTTVSYVQEWITDCATKPVGITASDNDNSWNEIERRIGEVNRFSLRFDASSSATIVDKFIHTLEV